MVAANWWDLHENFAVSQDSSDTDTSAEENEERKGDCWRSPKLSTACQDKLERHE